MASLISYFQPAPNDQSLYYLGQIFGPIGGGVPSLPGNPNVALGHMFGTFNSILLIIAVLMLLYITVIGVISTAYEGEFMGRKMNNIWIPIRAVLGIVFLVPTGAGYCLLQVVMMWVIVWGVGAADNIWNSALTYIEQTGSVYGQVAVAGVQTSDALTGLFQGIACDVSFRRGNDIADDNYVCKAKGGCGTTPNFTAGRDCANGQCTYQLGNQCGSLTYCDKTTACATADSLECKVCTAQQAQLPSIVNNVFIPTAQSLVNADQSYRDFYMNSWNSSQKQGQGWGWIYKYCNDKGISVPNKCCFRGVNDQSGTTCEADVGSKNPMPAINDDTGQGPSQAAVKQLYWPYADGFVRGKDSGFVSVSVNQYLDEANKAFKDFLDSQTVQSEPDQSKFTEASSTGWIFAGGYYYFLASQNNDNLKGSIPVLTWNPPDAKSNTMKNTRNNYSAAGYLVQAANGRTEVGNSLLPPGGEAISAVPTALSTAFSDNVTNKYNQNPLILIQAFGATMLMLANIAFVVLFALVVAIGVSTAAGSFTFFGTGLPSLPMAGAMIEMFILPAFYAGLALLVVIGGTLGIYTPLLPYVYFTFGALSWLISTIEAMVAGPLVALFVINPKGDHELMGKAEPALMLLFNIFLRPSLMIFGLIAAMLLAVVVVELINGSFRIVFLTNGVAHYDIISLILVLVAYVSLILAGLNQCFQVINVVPQKVMGWIGHQAEAVQAPTEALKGAVDSGTSKAAGAVTSSQGAADKAEARKKMQGGGPGTVIKP
jgi:hypothetical protein